MKVSLPPWRETVNETFIPLIDNKDRYLICYGGRGSSKSVFAAKKLIWRCLAEPYFRYILARNTYATIKDSSYQTIKDIIIEWGLQELFEFKLQPLEIHCANGNCFLARGCDDTTKIKSVKDPSGVWWEEDIPNEPDFITVTTSIRTTKADYLQEIFTINPEVKGDYQDHWFWKRFFMGKQKRTFSDITTVKDVPFYNSVTGTYENKDVDLTYTCHHSTYRDNKWIPKEFVAFLLDLKVKNPYYYTIYCEGDWGNKVVGGLFYKSFSLDKHVTDKVKYDPNLPLHVSWDDNRNPYLPCGVFQIQGAKNAVQIDEISGVYPLNTIKWVCAEFARRYPSHRAGLYIYGDATARKGDTKVEQGSNFFNLIAKELSQYKPVIRVPAANPSVNIRGQFMNDIMHARYGGISFKIASHCRDSKADFCNVKEGEDGKWKEMATDENGVRSQKWGHYSDLTDYFYCEYFRTDFLTFQRVGDGEIKRIFGINQKNNKRL